MVAEGGDAAGSSSSRPSSLQLQLHYQAALRDRYELQSLRGNGSFAEVWEARHRRTGHKVAIKIISHAKMEEEAKQWQLQQQQQARPRPRHLSPSSMDKIKRDVQKKVAREIRVMRLLSQGQHPHVIRFYEATPCTHGHTSIVMELAEPGGQLYDHVVLQGRLPEDQARAIFRQLAAAVLFCHRNMVAHRDLKMENVLLLLLNTAAAAADDGTTTTPAAVAVKVVDFGFSKLYTHGKPMRKKLGSPEYAAPELYGGGAGRYVGPQVDVWSCGVILYGMLCGGLPFDGADVPEIARSVRRGEYRVPSWVSDDARDLIAGMLIVAPRKRMTMADVMAHRWLRPADMPAYLAMPPPDVAAMAQAQGGVDEAAVQRLVTRYGFDRSSVLESLQRQQQHQVEDEATVAYQLVLATVSDAAARYLSMRRPSPEERWQPPDGGVLLRDCPRLTMERIEAALEELRVTIVSYNRRRHRIKCRADLDVPAPAAAAAASTSTSTSTSTAAGDGADEMNNHVPDESLSAAVFFEIQVYKTTGEGTTNDNTNNSNSQQEQEQEADEGEGPQYVVHLNRTSGPLLPYLSICSHLSSRLRRHTNI